MDRKKLTPEEFIKLWQTHTLEEMMEKTGWTRLALVNRAKHYRGKGVPLRQFRATVHTDWQALAELAKKYV